MTLSEFKRTIKPWMLPIAMICGVLFHNYINAVQWVIPYLIFTMLLITFCKVHPRELRITRLTWMLLAVQIFGSVGLYLVLRPFSMDIAQATFICILCPTATAAPVVTGMLGGNVARLATYSIVSNICAAISAPLFFTWMAPEGMEIDFMDTFMTISVKVAPLIILPLLLAFTLYFTAPRVHKAIESIQSISFYLWSAALIIVVGRAVSFVLAEPIEKAGEMTAIALIAGIVCAGQFMIGRRFGGMCGDKIASAQGLGQKNTILAIWMCLSFLNPISSIGPASYIAWQNGINSWQMYRKLRKNHGGNVEQ